MGETDDTETAPASEAGGGSQSRTSARTGTSNGGNGTADRTTDATPDGPTPERVTARWELNNDHYSRSPKVEGNAIYTRVRNGIAALDRADGTTRWSTTIGEPMNADIGLGPDRVYGGVDAGLLFAADRADGTIEWRFSLPKTGDRTGVRGSPLVTGGVVAFQDTNGTLFGLDVETGEELWRRDGSSIRISSGFLLGDTTEHRFVLRGGPQAKAANRVVDARSGDVVWSAREGYGGSAPPAVVDDAVVTSTSNGVAAYELDTGEQRWEHETFGDVRGQPAADGSRVFVGTTGNNVWGLALDSGSVEWRFQADGGFHRRTSHHRGTVVAGSGDQSFYFLDAETGAVQLEHATEFDLAGSVPVLDGTDFFHCGNASLHGLTIQWA